MSSMADPSDPVNRIGHNSSSFDQHLARLDLTGFHLARSETLLAAVRDSRLQRPALRVLAEIVASMDATTRTSWITIEELAAQIGIATRSVQNQLYELRGLGYIEFDKRPTPPTGEARRHYTLTRLDPAVAEAALTAFVERIRSGDVAQVVPLKSARPDVQQFARSDVQSGQDCTLGRANARSDVQNSTRPDVQPAACPNVQTDESCTPRRVDARSGVQVPDVPYNESHAGAVLIKKPILGESQNPTESQGDEISTCTPERAEPKAPKKPRENGSRLPADWVLPRPWGIWAVEHFECTREQVLSEAASFRDFWLSKSGAGATKVNWQLTWQNWIRSSAGRNRWRLKRVETSAGPDLLDYGAGASKSRHPLPRPDDVEPDIATVLRMMDGGEA